MRQNYVAHMDDNEDTQRKRNEYFDAVKRDVGELIGYKVPRPLLAKMLNEDIATVSDDAWMKEAYESVYRAFDNFEIEAYYNEVSQSQIDHIIAHFEMLLEAEGKGQDEIPE